MSYCGSSSSSSSNLFSCETCGDLQTCYHKRNISQYIRFMPNQVRTQHELRSISRQEREQVWADMFGVSSTSTVGSTGAADTTATTYEVNPDEETIQRSLQQMKELLVSEVASTTEGSSSSTSKDARSSFGAGTTTSKPAYQVVLRENPDYILGTRRTSENNTQEDSSDQNQNDYLLRFLYADKFNVQLAYQRMKQYFDIKLVLFGRQLLCCDISTIDNFVQHATALHNGNHDDDCNDDDIIDLEEIHAICEMYYQMEFVRFLSHVDYANRPILFARASKINYQHPKRNVRTLYNRECLCL